MSTNKVSPLRQRMIEDMKARKLGAHSQKSHIDSCKRLAAFLKRSPETATADDIRRFQLHLAESGISICNRNRIMTGLRFLFRRRDLSPPGAAEDPSGDEPGRDTSRAGRCHQPQGARHVEPWLWLRLACQ